MNFSASAGAGTGILLSDPPLRLNQIRDMRAIDGVTLGWGYDYAWYVGLSIRGIGWSTALLFYSVLLAGESPGKVDQKAMDLRQALESEVSRFRAWADSFPVPERSGEWECLYPDWQGIDSAFSAFVAATRCQEWDLEMTRLLLYIIARDNESQELVKQVAKRPEDLVWLAQQAIDSPERDAKWQLAAELSHLSRREPQVESLLLHFAHDTDEYVRRCGLMALADTRSESVEELIAPAWESGDEYQRMAVLYALWKVGSPQLDIYLQGAESDGRWYLVAYAARIRNNNP